MGHKGFCNHASTFTVVVRSFPGQSPASYRHSSSNTASRFSANRRWFVCLLAFNRTQHIMALQLSSTTQRTVGGNKHPGVVCYQVKGGQIQGIQCSQSFLLPISSKQPFRLISHRGPQGFNVKARNNRVLRRTKCPGRETQQRIPAKSQLFYPYPETIRCNRSRLCSRTAS